MRYLIFSLFIIWISLYVIFESTQESALVMPNFTMEDPISHKNLTYVTFFNQSKIFVSPEQMEILKNDYIKIWNHLDHLHNTNDILIGQRFYSEPFFKHLVKNYSFSSTSKLNRRSLKHQVYIQTFTPDGLICTLLDSNILIKYQTPHYYFFDTINVAMVLLYEGDNWRVDAILQF